MATLVAYGMPQKKIPLRSASGAPLHKTLHFDSKNFTGKVRDDFEKALRVALQRFIGSEVPEVAQAKFLFTPDIKTLSMALGTHLYDRVVYYGHALADGVTLAPLHRITAPQIAQALKGSGVKPPRHSWVRQFGDRRADFNARSWPDRRDSPREAVRRLQG